MLKLKDWVKQDKLNWSILCRNPNAIQMIEAKPSSINWYRLSENPEACHLLQANLKRSFHDGNPFYNYDDVKWNYISENPGVIIIK